MDIMTPFDFRDMFAEHRSLVLVGNAPSLAGERLGTWIDGHDVVVRFNEAALAGHETDVGCRTDILVTNPYPEGRPRPPLDGRGCGAVLVVNPLTRRGDKAAFAAWLGEARVLFTYAPDPWPLRAHPAGSLTTGVAVLPLLRQVLRPAGLSLTGFTMFLEDTAASYWSEATPLGVAAHDMPGNAAALMEIINGSIRHRLTVTAEIAWLARRIGQPLDQGVRVKPLLSPRWSD